MAKLIILYGQPDDPAAFEDYYFNRHLPFAQQQMPNVRGAESGKVTGTPSGDKPAYYRYAGDGLRQQRGPAARDRQPGRTRRARRPAELRYRRCDRADHRGRLKREGVKASSDLVPAPEDLGFGSLPLKARGFLLKRPDEDITLYGTGPLEAEPETVRALGGVDAQYLNHAHEASPAGRVGSALDAPPHVHAADAEEVKQRVSVDETFDHRHTLGQDLEVIPARGTPRAPRHTYGAPTGTERCSPETPWRGRSDC